MFNRLCNLMPYVSETASLIKASIAENTLKAYQRARRTPHHSETRTRSGCGRFYFGAFRVGSAVSLAQASATVVDMQVAGRWKLSQMLAHYAKAELAERGTIA